MRRVSTWALLAAAAACAPPVSSTSVVIPAPPAALVPTRSPEAKACRIEQERFLPPSPITLRTPRGAAFADLVSADRVEVTTRGVVRLEAEVFGLRLITAPAPADLPFYPREEIVFASVLRPGGSTPLRWTAPAADRWSVSPRDDERVEWIGAPPSQLVGCDAIALQPTALSHDREPQVSTLSGPAPIPLRATPEGPPVARLHAKGASVVVLAREGRLVHIDWALDGDDLDDAHVVGWVDASFVHTESVQTGVPTSCRGGAMSGSSDWGGCRRWHPLYVEVERHVEAIGTVLAGTRVTPGARIGNFERVEVLGLAVRDNPSPVTLREGVSFVMEPADAEDCR